MMMISRVRKIRMPITMATMTPALSDASVDAPIDAGKNVVDKLQ